LEVASGLVFIYLVLSTAASGIKEIIAHAFDMRAKTLEGAIRNMLADPGNAITSKIFQNHLIVGALQPGGKPAYISSRSFALSLFDLIAPVNPDQSRTVQDLKNGIANLPDPGLRSTVLGLFDSAQQDVDVARQRVETWYDDSMERVSSVYKGRAQTYIAALGLVLFASLNADTLMIVNELWNDSALRDTIATQARAQIASGQANQSCKAGESPINCIRELSVPPIGWAIGAHEVPGETNIREVPVKPSDWYLKILGILISSVAVAMGAPFWFNLSSVPTLVEQKELVIESEAIFTHRDLCK
jgi:hypothetical protein